MVLLPRRVGTPALVTKMRIFTDPPVCNKCAFFGIFYPPVCKICASKMRIGPAGLQKMRIGCAFFAAGLWNMPKNAHRMRISDAHLFNRKKLNPLCIRCACFADRRVCKTCQKMRIGCESLMRIFLAVKSWIPCASDAHLRCGKMRIGCASWLLGRGPPYN